MEVLFVTLEFSNSQMTPGRVEKTCKKETSPFSIEITTVTPQGGDLLDFWYRVLMCLFGVGEIIWGLKLEVSKCAIRGLKCGVGKIIWGLIFLVCHCPNHFLTIKFFFETGRQIIWDI